MLHPKILAYCQEDVVDIRGFDRCELHEAEEGRFVLRAYPGLDCGNNIGTIHGGFLLALVDIVGTGAVDTLGRENATLSLSANYLRPVRVDDEYIDVIGTILKSGKRMVVSEVEIRDAFLGMLVSYGRYLKINSFQVIWHSSRLHAP